eukprot:1099107-Prymnesium_polylepis.1
MCDTGWLYVYVGAPSGDLQSAAQGFVDAPWPVDSVGIVRLRARVVRRCGDGRAACRGGAGSRGGGAACGGP